MFLECSTQPGLDLQRRLVYCAVVGNLRKKYDKRPLLLSLAISRLPETDRSHGKAT